MAETEKKADQGEAVAAEEAEETTGKGKKAGTASPEKAASPEKTVSTGSVFQIPKDQLNLSSLQKVDIPNVRSRIQTEFESNRGYQMVATQIISVSQRHLANQQRDKVELRKKFANLFSILLILEYIFMVIFILLDAVRSIPVDVPDTILQLYITSVFLQTLSTIGVMIAFAFVSKEETRIVGLLNEIIQNYQKFQIDAPPKESKNDTQG